MSPSRPLSARAVVVGGSLGGLFAATVLRHIGWEVDVYERSARELDSRGGGIVLQPDVVELLRTVGATIEGELGVRSRDRVVYEHDGTVQRRRHAPQTQTSWSLVHEALRRHFPDEHYHRGMTFVELEQEGDGVIARFEDGTTAGADLLIGADGGGSTVRGIVEPGNAPSYAGYLAWRGLVPEREVPEEARELLDHFSFANADGSHVLGYLVPGEGGSTAEGERFYNYVWYRVADEEAELPRIMTDRSGRARGHSIPPGELADEWIERVRRDADALLPPPFRAMVHATDEPFAQGILDLVSERMVHDRVILLGDAAFIPRPHTAAGTSKAAADALALGEALEGVNDGERLAQALGDWERSQLQLGRNLYRQGSRIGDQLMFHPAAQRPVG